MTPKVLPLTLEEQKRILLEMETLKSRNAVLLQAVSDLSQQMQDILRETVKLKTQIVEMKDRQMNNQIKYNGGDSD